MLVGLSECRSALCERSPSPEGWVHRAGFRWIFVHRCHILGDFPNQGVTMSRKREPVRKIKEVLRLAYLEALSERQIALGANMKKTTVHDYLLRAKRASLTWSNVQSLDDVGIERLLLPAAPSTEVRRVVPDWGLIHTELRRKH